MAANKIYIQVDFQSTDAQAQIDAINQKLSGMGDATQQATAKGSAGMKGFSVSINQAASSVDQLSTALTGMGLAKVTQEFLGLGDSLLRLQMGLRNLTGGTDTWGQIRSLAEKTGTSFKDMVDNANNLRNAGYRLSEIPTVLKRIADQTAFAGKDQETLNRMVDAFAKLMAKGFVGTRDLVQFREIGLLPTQRIADQLNEKIQELRGNMRLLNVRAVVQDMLQSAAQQSEGAAAARADLLPSAQLQKLKNDAADLALTMTTTLAPALIQLIKYLRELMDIAGEVIRVFQSLPDWFKQLAEALFLAAIAAKAFSAAMALWRTLPGVLGTILPLAAKLGPAFSELGVAFKIIASGATLGTLDAIAVGFQGIASAVSGLIATLGPAALILGGIYVAYRAFEERALSSPEVTAKMNQAFKDREELAHQADLLEAKLTKAQQAEARAARGGHSYQSMTLEDLKPAYAHLQEIQRGNEQLLQEDLERVQKLREFTLNLIDEANKKNQTAGLESIAALTYEYSEHFRKIANEANISAKVRAELERNIAKALAISINTEGKKAIEDLRKELLKLAEERLAVQRKIATTRQTLQPDETVAGRIQRAGLAAQDWETQLRTQTEIANREYERRAQLQIAAIRKTEPENLAEISRWEGLALKHREETTAATDDKIQLHRLETEKETNQLIYEQQKAFREQDLQDQLDFIQKGGQLRVEALNAEKQQTLPGRLAQINAVHDAQIKTIQDTAKARKDAIDAEVQDYKDRGLTVGLDELAAQAARDRVRIEREATYEINLDRLNQWKETNDAIIEEQRKVYDSMKGAFDKIWDAFADRSKSVWSNLLNAAKQAIAGIAKELVTSRLAAAMTGLVTGRGVTFGGGPRGLAGTAPVFEGAGAPPVMKQLEGATSAIRFDISTAMNSAAGTLVSAASALTSSAAALTASAQALLATAGGGVTSAVGSASRVIEQSAATTASAASAVNMAATGGTGDVAAGVGFPMGGFPLGPAPVSAVTPPFLSSETMGVLNQIPGFGGGGATPSRPPTSLSSIMNSPAMAQMIFGTGAMMAMGGMQRKSPTSTILGSAMAGFGVAKMFPGLFNVGDFGALGLAGGAALGAGIGISAYGLMRGGKLGAGLSAGGGALAGAALGTFVFPGLGTLAGAAIGAAVGGIAGLIRLAIPGFNQQIRSKIKSVYGIDISNQGILQQIADIINQKYGGSISVGVYSQEVQDLVRLYSLSTGQHAALPRPMYSATLAQSGAGGLQLQPVYSGGQLVANPYVGTTTTQYANALAASQAASSVHIQLNPQQAMSLFSGEVVQVLGQNPGAVANANTSAARTGQSRVTQAGALMEPLTVTR